MKYYLGIDGGGTKTKFAIADENLNILGEYTGTPCHYMQCGFDGLADLVRGGISRVCAAAEISPDDIASSFIGCAGYGDVASDTPLIEAALNAGFGGVPFRVGNDAENALAGALGGKPGINIIAGTGSIGIGRNHGGDYMRCGGWHHAIGGDEGSGYWIGWNLLKEFSRQSDGRDEKTLLHKAVFDALRLSSDDEMVTRVIDEWEISRTNIASLAPVCAGLADEGDPYACAILDGCAKELSELALAIYKGLDFDKFSAKENPVSVSGTGGIFKIGRVAEGFAKKLADCNMQYVEPLYAPDIGALLLALESCSPT